MRLMSKDEMTNYLQSINETERMIKYYIDEYYFYELEDGYIIEFRKKPSIHSDMWFDDEYEIPNKNEDLFISYNMRMNGGIYHEIEQNDDRLKTFFIINYSDNRKVVAICRYNNSTDYEYYLKYYQDNNSFVRFMSDEEINEYNAICKELKEKYLERLKRYFKRYNSHIFCRGYWANR